MSKPYDLKALNYLRNCKEVVRRVKEVVGRVDPNAEVYVYGSTVTGKFTGASDIDVLVITSNMDKRYDIIVEVYKSVDAPIEVHVATPQQYERWYKRFIAESEIVKV